MSVLAYQLPKRIESFYELDSGIKLAVGLEIILHEKQLDTVDIRQAWEALSNDTSTELISEWSENKHEPQTEDWLKVDPSSLNSPGLAEDVGEKAIDDMVSKVKKFMDDESAGLDGAEHVDDDEIYGSADEEDFEEVVFDEDEFWRVATGKAKNAQPVIESDEDLSDEDDTELHEVEMKKMMEEMDAELAAANIKLNPNGPNEGSEDEVEIDLEFVRNMIESLKASGFAGPGAGMLDAMDAKLPHE